MIVDVVDALRVYRYPEQYNTVCHRVSEHPSHEEESQRPFDLDATTFDKWLPLIAESRGIKTEILMLPFWMVAELTTAAKCFKSSGRIMQSVIDDLIHEKPFRDTTLFDGRKWFVRADDVSPKDGEGSAEPVTTLQQLFKLLTTSWRLHGAYCRHKGGPFRLHLLPWDDQADTQTEFRVFVAPTDTIHNARVTAISQYSWWRSILPHIKERIPEVVKAAEAMLETIKQQGSIAEPLRQGFSFDLQCRDTIQLIELNGFGALQSTGSCLFNWVSDRHILYDENDESQEVVVRICE